MRHAWVNLSSFQRKIVVFMTIIAIGCSWGILTANRAVQKINKEGKDRRDQACLASERKEQYAREDIKLTYKLIEDVKNTPEVRTQLYQTIISQLPKSYKRQKLEVAPKYCNEKGIGLPEPKKQVPFPPEKDYSSLVIKKHLQ